MKIDGNQFGGGVAPESNIQNPARSPSGLPQPSGAEGARRAAKLGYENSTESIADSSASQSTDEVSLSDLGQTLSRLANADGGREARIEVLAAQYASGKLETDAGRVATKIVDDAFVNDDFPRQ